MINRERNENEKHKANSYYYYRIIIRKDVKFVHGFFVNSEGHTVLSDFYSSIIVLETMDECKRRYLQTGAASSTLRTPARKFK